MGLLPSFGAGPQNLERMIRIWKASKIFMNSLVMRKQTAFYYRSEKYQVPLMLCGVEHVCHPVPPRPYMALQDDSACSHTLSTSGPIFIYLHITG
jgi:hypothetical protein